MKKIKERTPSLEGKVLLQLLVEWFNGLNRPVRTKIAAQILSWKMLEQVRAIRTMYRKINRTSCVVLAKRLSSATGVRFDSWVIADRTVVVFIIKYVKPHFRRSLTKTSRGWTIPAESSKD